MPRFIQILLSVTSIVTFFSSYALAQTHAAFQVRNPNGVMRKHIQPSAILGEKNSGDWMVGSWSADWRSNYLYFEPLFRAKSTELRPAHDEVYYSFENSIYGPAFTVPLSSLKAIAFGIAYHQVIDGHSSLPLASSLAKRFSFDDNQPLPGARKQSLSLNNMQWYELSSTFATVNYIGKRGTIQSGITLKLLAASSLMAARLHQLDYQVQSGGIVTTSNYQMEMQYHIKNESNSSLDWAVTPKHPGVGIDAGISWSRAGHLPKPVSNLKLIQAGFSLRNIGGVWVRSDARILSGTEPAQREVDMLNSFYQLTNPADFPDSLSRAFDLTARSDAMQMGLPTKMSMEAIMQQGDWWFYTHAQVDMSFLSPFENTLSVPSRITFTPARYLGNLQLAIPASWIHRVGPELGVGASLNNFSLSINNILSLSRTKERRRFGIHLAISSPLVINGRRKSKLVYE